PTPVQTSNSSAMSAAAKDTKDHLSALPLELLLETFALVDASDLAALLKVNTVTRGVVLHHEKALAKSVCAKQHARLQDALDWLDWLDTNGDGTDLMLVVTRYLWDFAPLFSYSRSTDPGSEHETFAEYFRPSATQLSDRPREDWEIGTLVWLLWAVHRFHVDPTAEHMRDLALELPFPGSNNMRFLDTEVVFMRLVAWVGIDECHDDELAGLFRAAKSGKVFGRVPSEWALQRAREDNDIVLIEGWCMSIAAEVGLDDVVLSLQGRLVKDWQVAAGLPWWFCSSLRSGARQALLESVRVAVTQGEMRPLHAAALMEDAVLCHPMTLWEAEWFGRS
ncbi:hypothetical protein LTR53_015705, partial [Teratosphaeriaceae sp. CCFEE 6253]